MFRNTQDTSRKSYAEEKVKGLGLRQRLVYEAFKKMGRSTDREIADYLGEKDPNFVRPRRFELVSAGLVERVSKKRCRITKKLSIAWGIKKREIKETQGILIDTPPEFEAY